MESENLNTHYWLCNCGHLHVSGMYPTLCTCDFCGVTGNNTGVPQELINALKPHAGAQLLVRQKMREALKIIKTNLLIIAEAKDVRAKHLRAIARQDRVRQEQIRREIYPNITPITLDQASSLERRLYYRARKPKLP